MPVSVDWQAIEESIFANGMEEFPQIAADHPNRKIYCVFFDCDLVYTCVQAHMNTEEGLREYATDAMSRNPEIYLEHTIESLMEEFRWDGGGFRMFRISEGPDLTELGEAYEQLYDEIEIEACAQLQEPFMEACCRAVIRLDRAGAFREFQQRCDFRILVTYINEPVDAGEERMQRVLNQIGKV